MFIPHHNFTQSHKHRKLIVIVASIASFIFLIVGLGIFTYMRVQTYKQTLENQVHTAKTAWDEKQLDDVQTELQNIQSTLDGLEKEYKRVAFVRLIVGLNSYYTEGGHIFSVTRHGITASIIALEGIKPYIQVLGLTPDAPETSVQIKIEQLVSISPQLVPVLDQAREPLLALLTEIEKLNPRLYPQTLEDIPVRDSIEKIQANTPLLRSAIEDSQILISNMAEVLGEPNPTNYLLLFMNDKERRPIMGFITAFTTIQFDGGLFTIGGSHDIYEVSDEESYLPLPTPLTVYLKAGGFHLRDVNFSPDYEKSMDDFLYYWTALGQPSVDGVFAIDTVFLQKLIEVTGPISLPDYEIDYSLYPGIPESCAQGGQEFTSENVVCRLELFSQKIVLTPEKRKAIVGDLMNKIVDWILQAPQEEWDDLMVAVWEALQEKHLLLNFNNTPYQELAEKYNLAGRILSNETQQFWGDTLTCGSKNECVDSYEYIPNDSIVDYVHVNDANLAGLKSDFFITRKVKQTLRADTDGRIIKRVELTYNNTGQNDGWLNAVGRNYVRVYVPQGSELLTWEGGDQWNGVSIFEQLGYTVFDNFVLLPPLEERTLVFEYKLPSSITLDNYNLFIQKQPGLDTAEYEIILDEEAYKFELKKDILFKANNSISY